MMSLKAIFSLRWHFILHCSWCTKTNWLNWIFRMDCHGYLSAGSGCESSCCLKIWLPYSVSKSSWLRGQATDWHSLGSADWPEPFERTWTRFMINPISLSQMMPLDVFLRLKLQLSMSLMVGCEPCISHLPLWDLSVRHITLDMILHATATSSMDSADSTDTGLFAFVLNFDFWPHSYFIFQR